MSKIKIFALILACLTALSSCGIIIVNDGKQKVTEAETEEEITYTPPSYPTTPPLEYDKSARERLNSLPEENLDGLSVFIVAETESGNFFSEDDGSCADINRYKNKLVEDKYNAKIITVYDTTSVIHNAIKDVKKSGEYYADFLIMAESNFGKYRMDGFLGNLKSLPFTDYTAEYFDQEAMKLLSDGTVIYGAVGSYTENPRDLGCIYFNKTLGAELGIELDYSEIYNQGFTWDSYFEYINAVPKDKAAAVVSSISNDSIALFAFMSSGSTFVSKVNGVYKADFINSRTDGVIGAAKNIISKITPSFKTSENKTYKSFDVFSKGYALTAVGTLNDMPSLTNAGFSWEILPMPMYDGQDKYYSGTSVNIPIISYIAPSPNIDTSGYILQGLFAVSYDLNGTKFVCDAMKDTITGIYTPDMLEIIMSNTVYDIGYLYMNDNSNLKNGTYTAFLKAVSGKNSLNSYAKKYTAKLNNYLKGVE